MATKVVKLIVSASADASSKSAFKPIEQSAQKSAAVVAKEMDKSAKAAVKSATQAATQKAKASEKADAEIAKSQARLSKLTEQEAQRSAKMAGKAFDARVKAAQKANEQEKRDFKQAVDEMMRDEEKRTAAAKKESDKRERIANQEAKAAAKASGDRNKRVLGSAYGTLANTTGRVARFGLGVVEGVAGGMGADLSLGSNVGKNVSMQKTITDTVNSAASAQGKAGTLEDVKATAAAIKEASNESSTDYNKMSEGLMQFVQRSSDLKTGTAILKDMGKLARATGTDIGEIMEAAGPIAKQFEGQADAAERTEEAMRLVAKQGAMGNVEMRQLAPFMGRLAAGVNSYADPTHGISRSMALGQVGALAQISMQGGRTTASEATASAANFGRDLNKSGTQKAFKKIMGGSYSTYTDQNHEHLKLPMEIMMDVLKETHGNQTQIAALYKGTSSAAVMKGAASEYEKAGGGQAGLDHVAELFKRFSTTLEKEEVTKAAGLSEGTDEAKAQRFNNALQDATQVLMDRMAPSMEKIAQKFETSGPEIEEFANALVSAGTWISQNLGKTIAIAISASIAKAAIGDAITQGIKGQMGAGGAGLQIAAAAVLITAAGIVTIDKISSEMSKGSNKAIGGTLQARTELANARVGATSGGVSAASRERMKAELALAIEARDKAKNSSSNLSLGINPLAQAKFAGNAFGSLLGIDGAKSASSQLNDLGAKGHQGELDQAVKDLQEAIELGQANQLSSDAETRAAINALGSILAGLGGLVNVGRRAGNIIGDLF